MTRSHDELNFMKAENVMREIAIGIVFRRRRSGRRKTLYKLLFAQANKVRRMYYYMRGSVVVSLATFTYSGKSVGMWFLRSECAPIE